MQNHLQYDQQLDAKAALLARHFSYPDILTGIDLLTGKHLHILNPKDPKTFFQTHILGPGRATHGARAVVRHSNGDEEEFESFYRPLALPFDRDGMTSTISLSITGQAGLKPTPCVEGIINILRMEGYEPIVERSFRLCHWVIWLFLDEPSAHRLVEYEAYRLYSMIRDEKLIAPNNIVVPAIVKERTEVYVPYQFFAGNYFGLLYQLRGGALHPLDLAAVPHNRLGLGVSSLIDYSATSVLPHLEALVNEWWLGFGSHCMRASQILSTMRSSVESAFPLQGGVKHAQSVELGGYLKQLNGRKISGKTILSRPSGHSTVYWLEESDLHKSN